MIVALAPLVPDLLVPPPHLLAREMELPKRHLQLLIFVPPYFKQIMKAAKDQPMQLIGFDSETAKFTINQQALDMIREIKGPIGVVSVAGVYRTGKSFLTNRMLLNKKQGFKVSSTVQAETKGIWVWGKPILGQTEKNEAINVLVLDTEGISSLDQEANYDMKVITMSILLSSLLIYNSIGAIQKSQVETLTEVLKLVDKVSGKNASTCPSLLWVLRDFSLELKSTSHIMLSPNEYLEQALRNPSNFSGQELIFKRFSQIDCATLVRPLIDQNSLQYLDIADYESLVPEFVDQLIQLRRKVLNSIVPKHFNDKILTGEAWANMAIGYLNQLNNPNKIPELMSVWEYICQSECLKHSQICMEILKTKLQEGLKRHISQDSMKSLYKQSKQEALTYMHNKCKNNTELPNCLTQLKQSFSDQYMKVMASLHKEHLEQIRDFLTFQYQSIERKLKLKEISTLWEYKKEVQMFIEFGKKKAGNGGAREYIGDFVMKKVFEASSLFVDGVVAELESKKVEMNSSVLRLEEEVKSAKRRENQERMELQVKVEKLGEENKEYLSQMHQLEETVSEMKLSKEESQRGYWAELTNQKSSYQKVLNELKARISLGENAADEINREKIILQSELKKKDILYEKLCENHQQVLKDQKESYMKLLRDYSLLKESYHNDIRVADQKHGEKIKEYVGMIEELRGSLGDEDVRLVEIRERLSASEGRNRELESEKKALSNQLTQIRSQQQTESRVFNKKMAQAKFKLQKNTHLQKELGMLNQDNLRLKESNKQLSNEIDKQKALNEQKYHFIEIELEESRVKNQQYQEKFKQILTNFNNERIKLEQELGEWRAREFELRKSISVQEMEMEEMRKRNECLKSVLEEKEEEVSNTVRMYKEKQQNLENSKIVLESEMRRLESDNLRVNRMNEKGLEEEIGRLKGEAQRNKEEYQSDIEEIKLAFEQTLGQIRSLHEIEKSRLEGKLAEQKGRKEKKVVGVESQQLNKNLRETNQKLQDEILSLKKRVWDDEKEYKIKTSQLETKITLKNSEIDEMRNSTTITVGNSKDNDIESRVLRLRVADQKKEIDEKGEEIKKLITQNSILSETIKTKTQQTNRLRLTNELSMTQLQSQLKDLKQQASIYKVRMMESMDDHSEFKRTVYNQRESLINQKYLQSKVLAREREGSPSPVSQKGNMSFLKRSKVEGKIFEALREVEAIERIYGEAVRDASRREERHQVDLEGVRREKKVLERRINMMVEL